MRAVVSGRSIVHVHMRARARVCVVSGCPNVHVCVRVCVRLCVGVQRFVNSFMLRRLLGFLSSYMYMCNFSRTF